jgi:hypothetical protein
MGKRVRELFVVSGRRPDASPGRFPTPALWTTVVLSVFLPGLAAQSPPAKSPFIGSTVCKGCHPDVSLDFYKNAHYRSVAAEDEAPEETGCEGCHGPGRAHAEGRAAGV